MSKIVQAVNAMIANAHFITNTIHGAGGELFFLYKNKYKWSIFRRGNEHYLWFYPGGEPLNLLATYVGTDWEDGTPIVTYKDSEIGTKEAKASFSELYNVVKEKLYDVDNVLNDIISDDII